MEHRFFPVSKGYMRKYNVPVGGLFPFWGNVPLRLRQKGIDPSDACHCRLNGLDFHTKAFDGTPQELFTQRDDLYDLGLSRPDAVTLSMAVPDFPYCKSMKEFTAAMLERMGGTRK